MTDSASLDVRKLFGARVAELRKRLGWSQERLSLESGVARSYLGGVERGQRNIALVNICRLADTLGVNPMEMLNFRNEQLP
jgi:transcriptional regulator with XRE-family HTH domain